MALFSVTVGSTTYNAATASAVEQDKVLSLLSLTLMQTIFSNKPDEDPVKALVPMFLSLPQHVKQEVTSILCKQVFISGTSSVTVTVRDFENRMIEWNTLLAELTVGNFSDFFTWSKTVREEEHQTRNSQSEAQA